MEWELLLECVIGQACWSSGKENGFSVMDTVLSPFANLGNILMVKSQVFLNNL